MTLRPWGVTVAAVMLVLAAGPAADSAAEKGEAQDGGAKGEGISAAGPSPLDLLAQRHRTWFEDAEVLMSDVEKEVFLELAEPYQRDAFIRRFWKVRDPYPRTARNEFQERWGERVALARDRYGDLAGERARMVLFFGEPSRRMPITCSALRHSLDIWIYAEGSDVVGGYFTLVFLGRGTGGGAFNRLWRPIDGLQSLVSPDRFAGGRDPQLANQIRRACPRADDILGALAQSLDVDRLLDRGPPVPRPSDEWVLTFRARSTDLPEGTEPLPGEVEISFPGRHQSRTVVQGLVSIPRQGAEVKALGDHRGYALLVDGEILRQDELFDQFRYRFAFSADSPGDRLPLVVQRYLRPGEYRLVLKVEDTVSGRMFREERPLTVPRVEARRAAVAVSADGSVREVGADELAARGAAEEPVDPGARVAQWLTEANATISTGDHSVKIVDLPTDLKVGRLRVEATTRGEGIAKVAFELDDRPVMAKSRPPYSVEINLGDQPRFHSLKALALGPEGEVLARDQVQINAGPHRFDVRLLEPRRGKPYRHSVRAHADVDIPEGERLDRLELFLDETLVATLYQPPFEQPILLPEDAGMTFVRAVAHLRDGSTAEAVELINAPDYMDEVRVNFVELFTSVLDRKGNLVEDLTAEDFQVLEDGEPQTIRRFETMQDLPIRAGLLLDTSLSMLDRLPDVEKAAYRFLETVMTERDRASIITFADEPRLAVRFTHDRSVLAGGLADLVAEGETALYDSLIFSLHYFSGLKGKRALVVLTDGEDSGSRYVFSDVIEFARRTGVSIYVIGLDLPSNAREIRSKLYRLAGETGGECFLVDSARELGRVYDSIQLELRSQYLLAYQSSKPAAEEEFREVEVKVEGRGLEAKTLRGYYP
ncbi:MAG: VWA domain-containing protein [Acidobacteriota bacterium]